MKTREIVLLTTALVTWLAMSGDGQPSMNTDASAATTLFDHPTRASKVLGREIDNFQGRKFGTVKELAVDLQNGRIVEVIVEKGTFWNRNKQLVAVPPDVITDTGSGKLVYSNVDKKKLAQEPLFDMSRWSDSVAQPRVEAVYQCFDETPYFLVLQHLPKDANQPLTHPLGEVMRASQLMGATSANYLGEHLGEVQDLVVNLSSGRVVEVILDSGRYLGMPGELSAVPPQALHINPDRTVTLDTTRATLAGAPHFPERAWPQFDRSQIVAVYQAYHVLPYLLPVGSEDTQVNTVPPMDKTPAQADLDITGKVRKDLQDASGLSMEARDVKIATVNGRVTLRGVVISQEEKSRVGEIAARTVSASQVDNQLEIKEPAASASN